jgi:AcrR family transcriptional regulator
MHLTQGALFRHFSNKESIWQAVMEWVAEQLLYRIDEASKDRKSALEALEAMFITHIEFAIEYPGAPRILFGELQRSEQTPAKLAVHQLIQNYSERLWRLMERGKANQEFSPTLDSQAACMLFIGTIQGLVIQSLLAGDVSRMRTDALRVFAIYTQGIIRSQK